MNASKAKNLYHGWTGWGGRGLAIELTDFPLAQMSVQQPSMQQQMPGQQMPGQKRLREGEGERRGGSRGPGGCWIAACSALTALHSAPKWAEHQQQLLRAPLLRLIRPAQQLCSAASFPEQREGEHRLRFACYNNLRAHKAAARRSHSRLVQLLYQYAPQLLNPEFRATSAALAGLRQRCRLPPHPAPSPCSIAGTQCCNTVHTS